MASLILNLVGPQSWGISAYFKQRDTAYEPTQSGVYSLIEAAMGLDRSESYLDLNTLRFGVRVDRPGHLAVDFQTAQGVAMANGYGHKNEVIHKYYLADAHFLVALEGALPVLETIRQTLLAPQRPIHLGRRAFSPIAPIILPDSLQPQPLETVISTYPWCASHLFPWPFRLDKTPLRVVIDDPQGFEIRNDRRIGPPILHEFTQRRIRTYLVDPVLPEPLDIPTFVSTPIDDEIPIPIVPTPPPLQPRPSRKFERAIPLTPTELFEAHITFTNPLFNPLRMHVIHNLLLDVLRIGRTETKIPLLFRLDALANDQFKLVVRSPRRPDWSRLQLFDLVEQNVQPFRPPAILPGDQFKFSVRVNPTRKLEGKKYGLTEPAQQLAWLHRKVEERGGFKLLDITQHIQEPPRRAKHDVLFVSANFEGVGQVADKDRFKECLWRGVAASGGFAGFNMVQVIEDAA